MKLGLHLLCVQCPTCMKVLQVTLGPGQVFETHKDLHDGKLVTCEQCGERYWARPALNL